MRIVLLNDRIPPDGRGGAERVVSTLAKGLQNAGHDVHVITTTPGNAFTECRDGINLYGLHAGYDSRWRAWLSLYNPQTIPALRGLLLDLHPDVLNAHNIHLNLSYSALISPHGWEIPTVFTSHDLMSVTYGKWRYGVDPKLAEVERGVFHKLPRFHNLRQMRFRYNPFRNIIIRFI